MLDEIKDRYSIYNYLFNNEKSTNSTSESDENNGKLDKGTAMNLFLFTNRDSLIWSVQACETFY